MDLTCEEGFSCFNIFYKDKYASAVLRTTLRCENCIKAMKKNRNCVTCSSVIDTGKKTPLTFEGMRVVFKHKVICIACCMCAKNEWVLALKYFLSTLYIHVHVCVWPCSGWVVIIHENEGRETGPLLEPLVAPVNLLVPESQSFSRYFLPLDLGRQCSFLLVGVQLS